MDELELTFEAKGRKGEEALEVDATGMVPGDYITIRLGPALEPDEMRLTSYGDGRYAVSAPKEYRGALPGERYGVAAVSAPSAAKIEFRTKRDPATDAAKAAGGDFTA